MAANITSKPGGIADFVRAGNPADPGGALCMTEITPFFVKTLTIKQIFRLFT
jgi:hypothetical protein